MSNNSDDKNVALNFLAGLGLGALVGAVAALLLAPKSGKETREDIKVAADDLKEKADKALQELSTSSEELVQKSKDLLETTKTKVQQAIDAGKDAIARKQEEVGSEAEPSDE